MNCPFCQHSNPTQRATCGGCGSDLPSPTCGRCGVLVDWSQHICWRCSSLDSDTERIAIGGASWQVHGVNTPIVGRRREVHLLNELLKTCVEQRSPQICLVTAPSGLGKTRLLDEFNSQLDKHFDAATVTRGACKEGVTPPYQLFDSLLRNRFYIGDGEPGDIACHKLLEGVAALTPGPLANETAHFLGHLIGIPFPDSPHLSNLADAPQRLAERAFEALVRVFERDAQRAPIVLALEDLDFASLESINLISFLARELAGSPALIICSASPDSKLESLLEAAETPLFDIQLSPLADDESGQLLRNILRQVKKLPRELVELACERALGNPFTLEEIVRILLEIGVIETGPEEWTVHMDRLDPSRIPQSQTAVVRARLDALTDVERHVLQMASVIGNVFWLGGLTMLYRLDSDHWPESERYWNSPRRGDEMREVLDRLRRKDIIRRSATTTVEGETEFTFKHRLEREAIYESVGPDKGARLHKMIAQWLEFAAGYDNGPVEEIAHHYEQAGNLTKAAYYHIHAGDRARERYLNQKAVELYQKGLSCLAEDDAVSKIETLHNLSTVYNLIGEHDEALCYLREMLRYAWLMAHKGKGGVAFLKMGRVYRSLSELDFAMQHLQRAMRLFEDVGDERGIAAAFDDIGQIHVIQGDSQTALEYHAKAMTLRRELGDDRSLALSLARVGTIHLLQGDFPEALTSLRESLDLRKKTGDRRGVAESLNSLAAIFYEQEKFEHSVALFHEGLEAANEVGDRELQASILNNLGEVCTEIGRYDEAAIHLDSAEAISQDVKSKRTLADVLRNRGRLAMLRGEMDQAAALCERALALAKTSGMKLYEGMAWSALGEVHSLTLFDASKSEGDGTEDDAVRCFRKGIELLEVVGNEAELGKVLRTFGNLLIERGDTSQGKELLSRASEIFRRLQMRSILQKTERIMAQI